MGNIFKKSINLTGIRIKNTTDNEIKVNDITINKEATANIGSIEMIKFENGKIYYCINIIYDKKLHESTLIVSKTHIGEIYLKFDGELKVGCIDHNSMYMLSPKIYMGVH